MAAQILTLDLDPVFDTAVDDALNVVHVFIAVPGGGSNGKVLRQIRLHKQGGTSVTVDLDVIAGMESGFQPVLCRSYTRDMVLTAFSAAPGANIIIDQVESRINNVSGGDMDIAQGQLTGTISGEHRHNRSSGI